MTDVTLVTGAAGALGTELVRTLSRRGDRLVLVDGAPAKQRLETLAAELGGGCVVAGDLTDDATWAEAMPRIERELGAPPGLAALVAGGWRGGGPLHAMPAKEEDETWRAMMSANLETVHRSFARLLPPMVARKRGSIVVVGARAAVQPWTSAGASAYATSKAAVVALAQTVAAEVVQDGVRINAVMPSTMDTPSNRRTMPKADPAKWVALDSAAGVIAFLLSDAARDVSGAAIPLYGRS
jgi:NAD(P)-dependent dehydrogenase (short-subunit alcohol dehydrogenase family)